MKFNLYQRMCGWQVIYRNLLSEMEPTELRGIYLRASVLYDEYAAKYGACKGIKRLHVMSAVSEGALYLPLRDTVGAEAAVSLFTDGARPLSAAKHKKIEHLPAALFMTAAHIITNKMFGEKAGFRRQWLCNTSAEKRYDLLSCPYVDILRDMGCPEVCKAICIQDEFAFSGLKNGVIFERTQTLGNGGTCCDFAFINPHG